MTMDQWFVEQFGEASTNLKHHAEVLKCNIDTFEKTEKNTMQQIQWAVNCFGDWCSEKGCSIDFKQITKTELNALIHDFYGTVRSSTGEKYGISIYVALRAGLNRFLNDPPSLSWCLIRDSEFTLSNNVFIGVVKTMRREGRDKTEHHTPISTKDFSTIKLSDALNPNTPVTSHRSVSLPIGFAARHFFHYESSRMYQCYISALQHDGSYCRSLSKLLLKPLIHRHAT